MLEPEQTQRLRELLIKHEGVALKPYVDTVGKKTIGVGRNLDDGGISIAEAMMMLTNDMNRVEQEAVRHFDWFHPLSPNRKNVVLSMLFNLGLNQFRQFNNLIASLIIQNYAKAAQDMLDSKWAVQVKGRAKELALMMLKG